MRILIIGSTSSLCIALVPVLSSFAEVLTAGRKSGDIALDLTRISDSTYIPENLDVVINTSAHFGGDAFDDYKEALSVNVIGILNLINACKKANTKRIIHVSSIYSLLSPDSLYYSIYSISKKHADEIAWQFCSAYSMPLTVIRPSQIYGNDDSFRKHQPFFYTMVDKAENGENITIYGTNDAKRNYIHIDDLTAVISRIIQNQIYGIYQCAHTTNIALSEIANAAYKAFNRGGEVYFDEEKPNIEDNVFPEDVSLYEMIDYYPQISIEDGLKQIARYKQGMR